MASIDVIVNELNPMYDMGVVKEAVKPINPIDNTLRENLKILLSRVYTLVKPIVRGGVSGAGVGALVSFISGNDVGTGASYGAFIGANIDSAQYYPRTIYQGVKSIFK